MKKQFKSYDQYQLKELSDSVCDDIENLLDLLQIDDYKILGKMITMSCPIHGGDNSSAFNLYHQGDSYRGNWKCRTHQCENTFKSSIIGFIRGCISHNKYNWTKNGDTTASFNEAVEFTSKFAKQDLDNIHISKKEKEKQNFTNTIRYLSSNKEKETKQNRVSRQSVIKNLKIPSQYFLSRGFSTNILTKYDIGDCLSPNKEMSDRAVVPIYDGDHKFMIGCSGRTINDSKPKWKHNDGFKAEEYLYNFWYAKDYIQTTRTVILVESPGNVWRLEEAGIHNSVAVFGSSLKDKQKMLLDTSGAMTLITIMDNDDAGRTATQQIIKKCERTYICKSIDISYTDIAEMPIDKINLHLKPIIEGYYS
jgi:hypothetical protein